MNRRDLFRTAIALGLATWAAGCGVLPGGKPNVAFGTGPTQEEQTWAIFSHLSDALVAHLGDDAENLALSPFSIGSALAMVRQGAAGRTASELDELLRVEAAALAAAVNTTWQAMTQAEGDQLNGANAIWAQRDYGWKQPYLDSLKAFGAPLQERDIASNPEAARAEINAWVADVTHGKIPELLPTGLIDQMTRMVLVNALRFAAAWQQPLFDQGTSPFRAPSGTKDVPWLAGGGAWRWFQGPNADATVIPCEGDDFGLALVLPRGNSGVRDVLTRATLDSTVIAPTETVAVGLPKFTIRTQAALADALKAIGLQDAFDRDAADFSAMTDQEKLFIGFVQHEAVVAIDENGIEAAAATAVGMTAGAAPAEPKQLILDRPFGYALMHLPTVTPLFVGIVADPSA